MKGAADRPEPGRRFLTIAETADLLRLHPMTVRAMVNKKTLPACRFGRAIRIDAHRLEEQISQGLLAQGQAQQKARR